MAGEASGGELEQEPSGTEAASSATSDVAAAAETAATPASEGGSRESAGWHVDGAADGGAMAGEASGGELESAGRKGSERKANERLSQQRSLESRAALRTLFPDTGVSGGNFALESQTASAASFHPPCCWSQHRSRNSLSAMSALKVPHALPAAAASAATPALKGGSRETAG